MQKYIIHTKRVTDIRYDVISNNINLKPSVPLSDYLYKVTLLHVSFTR